MAENITVRGFVATDLDYKQFDDKLVISSFRLGAPERRQDKSTGEWHDGDTNWYTVKAFRELARNVYQSLDKGQRVVVSGRLKVKQFKREDGSFGTSVEIEAETVGHDMLFGVSRYVRTSAGRAGTDPSGGPQGGDESGESLDEATGVLGEGDVAAADAAA